MKKYRAQSGILVCGLILGFLLGGAGGLAREKAKPAEKIREGPEMAWLVIEKGEGPRAGGEAWKFASKDGESLFQAMNIFANEEKLEMKTKNFPGLGVMIEELEGRKNGEHGNYWQYWVNEEYAKVGADAYIPQGGDTIEWRFTHQQNF